VFSRPRLSTTQLEEEAENIIEITFINWANICCENSMVMNLSSANQWVYNNDRGNTQFVLFKGFFR
jgi:hypothetical protein